MNTKSKIIFLSTLFIISQSSFANCDRNFVNGEDDYFYWKYTCNQDGSIKQKKDYFKKTNGVSTIEDYHNNKVTRYRSYNLEGDQVVEERFSHFEDGTYLKKSINFNEKGQPITGQSLMFNKSTPLKRWYYKKVKNGVYNLYQIDTFIKGSELVIAREIYKKNKKKYRASFTYDPHKLEEFLSSSPQIKKIPPTSFKVFNAKNEKIGGYKARKSLSEDLYKEILYHCNRTIKREPILYY